MTSVTNGGPMSQPDSSNAIHAVSRALYWERHGDWGYDPGKVNHRLWTERAKVLLDHAAPHIVAVDEVVHYLEHDVPCFAGETWPSQAAAYVSAAFGPGSDHGKHVASSREAADV